MTLFDIIHRSYCTILVLSTVQKGSQNSTVGSMNSIKKCNETHEQ